MKTRKLIYFVIVITLLPLSRAHSQDYYSGRESLSVAGYQYNIETRGYYTKFQNAYNYRLNQNPYRIGSSPVYYYTYANGWLADPILDEAKFNNLIERVFTEDEILYYTNHKGHVGVCLVMNPNNQQVLEVLFRLYYSRNDKTILSIPPAKLAHLERLIFETNGLADMSDELRQQNPSYYDAWYDVF
ncbi:MAG: hypothetical protein MJY67_03620 [Bacteroidales bacterium]|nr:hypothetical protein [Bacteroidales bacterium]